MLAGSWTWLDPETEGAFHNFGLLAQLGVFVTDHTQLYGQYNWISPGNEPGDLEDFAGHLKMMSGRIVVSGHSNTTPGLVRALGGDPGEPINESEYDRLYVLVLLPGGGVETVLIRY